MEALSILKLCQVSMGLAPYDDRLSIKELVEIDMRNCGFHLGLPAFTAILYKDIATRARPLHVKAVPNQTIGRQGFPTV